MHDCIPNGYRPPIGPTGPTGPSGAPGATGPTGPVFSPSSVKSVTSGTYQVLSTDFYIGCNGTGITVTLPLGSLVNHGQMFVIKDESGLATSSPAYRFTVLGSGSNTIDGGSRAQILTGYSAITVLWTGILWSII